MNSAAIDVAFGSETARFDLDPDRFLGQWTGPAPRSAMSIRDQVRRALGDSSGYPPLSRSVVPGDRVVIPTDSTLPGLVDVLGVVCEVLIEAGVEAGAITVLFIDRQPQTIGPLPDGVVLEIHDPADASRTAYLATTKSGRRIYMDRLATDADVVVPVGPLCQSGESPHGPWSMIFPGLTNLETRDSLAQRRSTTVATANESPDESPEVSWLLGSQYHVGVLVGASGAIDAIAGHQDDVRQRGIEAIRAGWSVRVPTPAELVIAGVGVPWRTTTLEDLAAGLETAARLARVGGKVVLLTDLARFAPGPALQRLAEQDDPRQGLSALRGLKRSADYPAVSRIVKALARSDVYLCSGLDPDLVEAIGMIALDRPDEARRLVQLCDSYLAISPAEWMRVETVEETAVPARDVDGDY